MRMFMRVRQDSMQWLVGRYAALASGVQPSHRHLLAPMYCALHMFRKIGINIALAAHYRSRQPPFRFFGDKGAESRELR